MLKIYRWFYRFFEKKIREHCPPYCDLKCPNCNTWSKVVEPKSVNDWPDKNGYDVVCGQCGYRAEWNTSLFPVPVLAKQHSQ